MQQMGSRRPHQQLPRPPPWSGALMLLLGLCLRGASAAVNSSHLVFLSLGDWGVANRLGDISKQMGAAAETYNASFVVLLGDNFYENGVSSEDPSVDGQWNTTYRDVFTSPALEKLKFYVVRGNHDWHTNPDAEIAYYMNKRDERWTLPGPYYLISQPLCPDKSCNGTVDLVLTDSVILAPQATEAAVQYPSDREQQAHAQLSWVEKTLNESTADYVFVIGHYPVFSTGEHGDTQELIRDLQPMLEKYHVDGYICGHDHTIQHLKKGRVSYLVNGNGAKDGTLPHKSQADSVLYSKIRQSFMVHEVHPDNWKTTAISATGEVLYSFIQQGGRHRNSTDVGNVTILVRTKTYAEDVHTRVVVIVAGCSVAFVLLVGLFLYRVRTRAKHSGFSHSRLPVESADMFDEDGDFEMEEL